MKKFEAERITTINLNTNVFKHPIPIVCVKPLHEDESSCVFIYNCGLGGTNALSLYMNNFAFDTNYFITYEKMNHGDNHNKPSQYKKPFLKELDCVVNWVKQNYPNKKIYLLGESWGCAINFLYLKKYTNKISGVINWNMPTKVKPPKNLTFKAAWASAWRELATFITNMELKLPLNDEANKDLTTDPILLRAINIYSHARRSSRLALAVWRYMWPSYRFLLKNSRNDKYNFLYIQSGEDALMTKKHIDKIMANADDHHFLKLDKGYHIMSMEPNEADKLYTEVLKFVQKKN